jgi:hypothetical protein
MKTKTWVWTVVASAVAVACGVTSKYELAAQEPVPDEPERIGAESEERPAPDTTEEGDAWTTAVEPKPLGDSVRRGLEWLVSRQLESGGWGQGEESAQMRSSQGGQVDKGNVADTCMATLSLLRSGSTPSAGRYADELRSAIAFLCASIEAHEDDPSLWVTDVRGTRVQGKIGTYIGTFMASMVLPEVQGKMPDDEGNARVKSALATVLDKIERNQSGDGTWDNQGWAPVLAQSMAGKGMNRARQMGFDVSLEALEATDDFTAAGASGPGSAGVPLYSSAAGLGVVQDLNNTNAQREGGLRFIAENGPTPVEREEAQKELKKIEDYREVGRKAKADVIGRLDDPSFVAGFGSNGGEEFLSYMNISESLVVDADDAWRRWDGWVGDNLNRVQNQDGSWTGHHCITGRTFCTAAALLTLMADRTPVPVELVASAE